jgi:hypothetical protein
VAVNWFSAEYFPISWKYSGVQYGSPSNHRVFSCPWKYSGLQQGSLGPIIKNKEQGSLHHKFIGRSKDFA